MPRKRRFEEDDEAADEAPRGRAGRRRFLEEDEEPAAGTVRVPRDPSRRGVLWAAADDLTVVREYVVVETLTDDVIDALLEAEAIDAAAEMAAEAARAEAGAGGGGAALSGAPGPLRLVDYGDDDDSDDEDTAAGNRHDALAEEGAGAQALSPMQRAGAS